MTTRIALVLALSFAAAIPANAFGGFSLPNLTFPETPTSGADVTRGTASPMHPTCFTLPQSACSN